MPHQTEPSANAALGTLLQRMLPGSQVLYENTQVVVGHAGRQPDVLITTPGRSPVIIEAEFFPALTVQDDAKQRLGLHVVNDSHPVEAVIALRYPEAAREADDLHATLREAQLSYCILTQGEEKQSLQRMPDSGWLQGSLADLADLIGLVSVPQQAVDQAVDALETGIETVARKLDEMASLRPGITAEIARLLGMADLPQTRRMACAIVTNAMIFHDHIAGMHQDVRALHIVCGPRISDPQARILEAWAHILTINYWPIFAIAKDLVTQLPAQEAAEILHLAQRTAGEVAATGVTNGHDLTGRIFQRLIADRKYLATFTPCLHPPPCWLALQSASWKEWIGAARTPSAACASVILPAAPGLCYPRYMSKSPHGYEREAGNLGSLAPHDDGRSFVRMRRYALCHPHHRFHPFWCPAQRQVW